MIHLRSDHEIEAIGHSGMIIGRLFEELHTRIAPGVSTADLDSFAESFIRSYDGAEPAFKGLYGFPGSVCISLNEEVVHGIPRADRVLAQGDVVSVDVGVRRHGWCSDSAWTFAVGDVDQPARHLMEVTRTALARAIAAAVPGQHVGDIGAAIMEVVDGTGLGIVRDLVGHGVGREVHEEPQVPNVGRAGYGPSLRTGMVIAIEPMLSLGTDRIQTLDDGWTVVTADATRAAHFEHTIAVTAAGPRILTGAGREADAAA